MIDFLTAIPSPALETLTLGHCGTAQTTRAFPPKSLEWPPRAWRLVCFLRENHFPYAHNCPSEVRKASLWESRGLFLQAANLFINFQKTVLYPTNRFFPKSPFLSISITGFRVSIGGENILAFNYGRNISAISPHHPASRTLHSDWCFWDCC